MVTLSLNLYLTTDRRFCAPSGVDGPSSFPLLSSLPFLSVGEARKPGFLPSLSSVFLRLISRGCGQSERSQFHSRILADSFSTKTYP